MIEYLTVDQLLQIHTLMIKRHGGLPGLRDENLLLSSLAAPKQSFGGQEMYPSIYEKAAIYLYSLAKNHPFNDANKRTAYFATLLFLKANKAKLYFNLEELEEVVVLIANGKMEKSELFGFFKSSKD